MASDPPRPRSLDEILAEIRGGFAPRSERGYPTELPERFRKPRPPKPPPEPTVGDRGLIDEALARVRGTYRISATDPDLLGKKYEPETPAPHVDPGLIQKKTEDEIAVGAKHVADTGGDPEEYVRRMHDLRYGKRISSMLKAGRDLTRERIRQGTKPEEAEAAGIDLAQKHIANLEQRISAGEQELEAADTSANVTGLIEGFTTRKGIMRNALETGLPIGKSVV